MNSIKDKRIFIVDDDPFWSAILQQMLTDIGCKNITLFASGTDCVANLHQNPGMVFLDYQMDDMDGIEVLKRIKDYYPGIGVVFCTAYEDLSIAVDALAYGSYDYLLKENANLKEVSTMIDSMTQQQTATAL